MLGINSVFSQKDSLYFARLADQFRSHLKANLDSAKITAVKLYNEASAKRYTKGIAIGSNYKGICFLYEGNYDSAIVYFNKALSLYGPANATKGVCDVYSNLGVCYDYLGKFSEAIRHYLSALKVAEQLDDENAIARASNNLGAIFYQQNNYKTAMSYFERSLKIREKEKDVYGIASCCLNIGSCLSSLKNYSSSSAYLKRSIENARFAGDSVLLADGYVSLAQNFNQQKDFKQAIELFNNALAIYQAFSDQRSQADLYCSMAGVYTMMKDHVSAHRYYLQAYSISSAIRFPEGIKKSTAGLVQTFAYLQKPDSAAHYLALYSNIRDTIFSENSSKQIADMQTKYETEKKDRELKVKDLEIEKQSVESRQKAFQRNAFIIGFLVMIIMSFFIFKEYKEKKRSVIEVSAQKKIIEEKNKDITDSINYAKRIQEVILPPLENATLFPGSFVLFLPMDVVSGDFYWYAKKNGKKLVAAVDCTGHGVPGALMSMLGNAFLNEIVNEKNILQPSEILGELRNKIKTSLKQTGEVGESKDGMDMALLSFDTSNNVVEFAGANNPLWLVRKVGESFEIKEYSPDKRPIGYYIGQSLPFTNHVIDLKKGDSLYIFTDGFADQFGGPKGKKFKSAQLRQQLISLQEKSMNNQREELLNAFTAWKGRYEQVDDVCVIGIRV
ncbi:MAG: tetratricopeptide repeat protein [Bacteroidia bacterium]